LNAIFIFGGVIHQLYSHAILSVLKYIQWLAGIQHCLPTAEGHV
jgi:hypothetical protein